MEAGHLVPIKRTILGDLVNANECVRQGCEKYKDIFCKIHTLEASFNDVYNSRRPTAQDYDNRRDVIRIFNGIAEEIYGKHVDCPVVEEFGSFTMDMFDAKSDLDLSINFRDLKAQDQRATKVRTLRKFANKLCSFQYKGSVENVLLILSARVPVLKVTHCATKIECDLSVGNMDGIAKSHIIHSISAIDERFQKLCCLVKAWAKAHDINSSKDGTLNSISLVSLAAFHLQTRDPPILPPFSAIFREGVTPEAVKKTVPSFLQYGKGNTESVADLFVSLLILLESVKELWSKGIWVSVFEGAWIYDKKSTAKINVEDFIDRSQNTARAVKKKKIGRIYSVISSSLQQIRSFAEGKEVSLEMLKVHLFCPEENTGVKKKKKKKRKKNKKKNNENAAISGLPPPTSSLATTSKESVGGTKRKRQTNKQKESEKEKPVGSSLAHANTTATSRLPPPSQVGFRPDLVHEPWRYNLSNNVGGTQNHPVSGSSFSTHGFLGFRPTTVHVEPGGYSLPNSGGGTWNPPLPSSNFPAQGFSGFRADPVHFEPWRRTNPNFPPSAHYPHSTPPYDPPFQHPPPHMQGSYGYFPPSPHVPSWHTRFPTTDSRAPSPYGPRNVMHQPNNHPYLGGPNDVWYRG